MPAAIRASGALGNPAPFLTSARPGVVRDLFIISPPGVHLLRRSSDAGVLALVRPGQAAPKRRGSWGQLSCDLGSLARCLSTRSALGARKRWGAELQQRRKALVQPTAKEVAMRTQPVERTPAPVTAVRRSPVSRTVTPVGRFLAELGGMCAVMCVGGSILGFVSFQAASWLGY